MAVLGNAGMTIFWPAMDMGMETGIFQRGYFNFAKEIDGSGSRQAVFKDSDRGLLGYAPVVGEKNLELNKEANKSGLNLGEQVVKSKLDPYAKEWDFWHKRAPEHDRCLYLTFSKGYPLTEIEILQFFNLRYGPCVERVNVHRLNPPKRPAQFGKVVFLKSAVPAAVLNGQDKAKFIVNGRTMWCKKFQLGKNN